MTGCGTDEQSCREALQQKKFSNHDVKEHFAFELYTGIYRLAEMLVKKKHKLYKHRK